MGRAVEKRINETDEAWRQAREAQLKLAEVKKDAEWRLGFLKSTEQARDEALARARA